MWWTLNLGFFFKKKKNNKRFSFGNLRKPLSESIGFPPRPGKGIFKKVPLSSSLTSFKVNTTSQWEKEDHRLCWWALVGLQSFFHNRPRFSNCHSQLKRFSSAREFPSQLLQLWLIKHLPFNWNLQMKLAK